MKTSLSHPAYLLMLTVLLPAPVLAGNYSFLEYDPVAHFNKEDWRIWDEAAVKSLDENPDGVTTLWENPKSGASGTITPLSTYEGDKGQRCRQVRTVDQTRAPRLKNQWMLTVCQDDQGKWVFDTPRRKLAAAGSGDAAGDATPSAAE